MALSVVEPSFPINSALDVAINSYIKITFNSEIKQEYLFESDVANYFQLYKKSNFVKQGIIAGKTTDNNLEIYLKPLISLEPNTEYILIVLGGTNGVKNILDEYLNTNWALEFKTGNSVAIESIEIVDYVVTFSNIEAEQPISESETNLINFQDVNNSIGSETGVYIYDLQGIDLETGLRIEYSSPEDGSTGIKQFEKINLYFTENIENQFIEEIKVSKSNLPFESDIFGNHGLYIKERNLTENKIELLVDETGIDISTNKEYTVFIPKNAVKNTTTPVIKNDNIYIKFSGPLSPMFSTPDYVKNMLVGFEESYIDNYDNYNIFKTLHINSKEILMLANIVPSYTNPDQLYWLSRYVTCKTVLDLLTGPFGKGKRHVTHRSILGQSTSWSAKSQTSSKYSPLEECIRNALRHLGIGSIGTNIGVKSINSNYYPGRERNERREHRDIFDFRDYTDGVSIF